MRRTVSSALITAMLVVGCGSQAATDPGYNLEEFSITGPDIVSRGSMAVTATNSGEFPHTVVVTSQSGQVVAATDLIQPGTSAVLDIDLAPGTYEFTCRIVAENEGQLIDHFEQGMHQVVRIID